MSKMLVKHILILAFRALLLVTALYLYFSDKTKPDYTEILSQGSLFLFVVWIVLVIGMVLRIVPNKQIAMGARKHYRCSYNEIPDITVSKQMKNRVNKGVIKCAIAWIAFSSALFFLLYMLNLNTPPIIMIIVLTYSVLDIIFILCICPFKMLFMRNRCCAVCRIYNWDYFMMCTPMLLFPHIYSISLLILSVVVLLTWEISVWKNPGYFVTDTNKNLSCEQCKDRLCLLRRGK
ncbi:MAG: hypothetical protein LBI27_04310 [Clostridiales bacterium]|jgi:hypothetical protein|nr:hypothetical protein [Clostridiales bacterium]